MIGSTTHQTKEAAMNNPNVVREAVAAFVKVVIIENDAHDYVEADRLELLLSSVMDDDEY